jgi:DNA-binding response OmpR family regulator
VHGNVIVIDDDDEARRLTADALRELGWRVFGASDLRAAVELTMEYQPRGIITELTLPAVHGYAFVRTLRSAVDNDVVLVGLTKLPSTQIDAARAMFDEVFEKPADITHIHERILQTR